MYSCIYLYVWVTFFLWWKKHYNFSQLKQVIAYDHLILIINEPFLFRVSKIYFHAWYRKRNCLSPIQGHPRIGAATCQCVGISQPTDTILLEWWYRCHSALAAVSKLRQSSARVFHFLSFKFYNFARNKIGKQYFFLQISHFGWQLLRYDFRLSILARNSLVSFREKFRYSS